MPAAQRQQTGVRLPLPSGTRYLQFRITFVGAPRGGVALDYIEFDYDEPLMRHGAVAEIYPERVAIGEDVLFTYVLKPIFSHEDTGHFSGVEIDVPSAQARIENFSIDGVSWQDISDAATGKMLEKGASLRSCLSSIRQAGRRVYSSDYRRLPKRISALMKLLSFAFARASLAPRSSLLRACATATFFP